MHEAYKENFPSGVSCIKYHFKQTTLLIGLDNGEIRIFKIYIRENADISKNLVDQISSIKPHKKSVSSIEINPQTGYLFSISNDCNLVISEINYQSTLKTIPISKGNLISMIYNEDYELLLLGDSQGTLYFYRVSNPINPVKLQVINSKFKPINIIKLNETELYVGTKNGEVNVFTFNIDNNGLEMNEKATFYTENNLKVTNIFISNGYITIGLSNGSIAVFVGNTEYPECKVFI